MTEGGARWLSGRSSDSGARGRVFETYLRCVVSLSKTLYTPKSTGNTQEAAAPPQKDWKFVDWDVKPQHKQTNKSVTEGQNDTQAENSIPPKTTFCWGYN